MKHVFKADDGTEFGTLTECRSYEEGLAFQILANRNEKEIDAALRRDPEYLDVSNALEKAGNLVSKRRRSDGDFRRAKRSRYEDRGLKDGFV